MKKFLVLLRLAIKSNIYYRTSLFFNMFSPLVVLGGQLLMWRGLYNLSEENMYSGMVRSTMYAYILIAFVLNNSMNWSTENHLSKEIRNGDIVARVIRPVSFFSQNMADMLGSILVQGAFYVLFIAIVFAMFRDALYIPSCFHLVSFLISAFLGLILRMVINDIFGLMCFFVTSYLGIAWMKNAIISFFSGALIPVSLFPEWLRTISAYMPFEYMIHIPIAIFIGEYQMKEIMISFMLQGVWIFFFIMVHMILYRKIRLNMVIAGG